MKEHKGWLYNRAVGNFLAVLAGMTLAGITTYVNGDYGITKSVIPILIGFFISAFWIIRLHALRHAYKIEIDHNNINHSYYTWRGRLGIILGFSFLFHWWAEAYTLLAWPRMVGCFLYLSSIFWLFFDFMLNDDRNRHWGHISNRTRIDRFFKKYRLIWLLSKLLFFLAASYLYYKSFNI